MEAPHIEHFERLAPDIPKNVMVTSDGRVYAGTQLEGGVIISGTGPTAQDCQDSILEQIAAKAHEKKADAFEVVVETDPKPVEKRDYLKQLALVCFYRQQP